MCATSPIAVEVDGVGRTLLPVVGVFLKVGGQGAQLWDYLECGYPSAVDKGVYTMPVKYRSIAAGLADVFRTLKTGEPISHSHFDWLGQYQASISRGFH